MFNYGLTNSTLADDDDDDDDDDDFGGDYLKLCPHTQCIISCRCSEVRITSPLLTELEDKVRKMILSICLI
jgi:hypothetical protein